MSHREVTSFGLSKHNLSSSTRNTQRRNPEPELLGMNSLMYLNIKLIKEGS